MKRLLAVMLAILTVTMLTACATPAGVSELEGRVASLETQLSELETAFKTLESRLKDRGTIITDLETQMAELEATFKTYTRVEMAKQERREADRRRAELDKYPTDPTP